MYGIIAKMGKLPAKRKRITTTRQMATIRDVIENKLPVSTAMRRNGYTEQSARKLRIKDTEAWKEVMETYLPDHKLFKTHQDALEATKWNDFTGERETDHQTRLKAVDMAYKLKGKMSENVGNSYQQINIRMDGSGYVPQSNVLGIKPTLSLKPHKNKHV